MLFHLLEGVPQDAILQDEEQIKENNEKLEKLKSGSCTKSLGNDYQVAPFTEWAIQN